MCLLKCGTDWCHWWGCHTSWCKFYFQVLFQCRCPVFYVYGLHWYSISMFIHIKPNKSNRGNLFCLLWGFRHISSILKVLPAGLLVASNKCCGWVSGIMQVYPYTISCITCCPQTSHCPNIFLSHLWKHLWNLTKCNINLKLKLSREQWRKYEMSKSLQTIFKWTICTMIDNLESPIDFLFCRFQSYILSR